MWYEIFFINYDTCYIQYYNRILVMFKYFVCAYTIIGYFSFHGNNCIRASLIYYTFVFYENNLNLR